jgi:predicted ATP-binding protein involved in virulence
MKSISIIEHTVIHHSGFVGEHKIELVPNKTTVIFGVNGAGKTSLLNSLYGSVMIYISNIVGFVSANINLSNVTVSIGKSQTDIFSKFLLEENNSIEEFLIGINISISGSVGRNNKTQIPYLARFKKTFDNGEVLPLFRYFQTEKGIDKNKTSITNISFGKLENRNIGYENHFDTTLSIDKVVSFLINQINIENQEKIDRKNFNYTTPLNQYIKTTLNLFTKTLYNADVELSVKASKYSSGQSLQIKKGDKTLEFIQLSSGEKYVFAMVLELIYRNVLLNPNSTDLRDTPGIVLIDEVENHLHPRWQLTIIKALETCFPKIQFIVSSHSDLIATSVRKEQIIALNDFEVIPSESLKDVYAGTANEALENILFSDNHISDFDTEKKEISRLLNQYQFDLATEKLENVKSKVGDVKWIKDFERRITFARL